MLKDILKHFQCGGGGALVGCGVHTHLWCLAFQNEMFHHGTASIVAVYNTTVDVHIYTCTYIPQWRISFS